MGVQLISLSSGAALFDDHRMQADVLADLLQRGRFAAAENLSGAAGRAGVRMVNRGAGAPWVWRHNHRGGWVGRFVRDRYLWLGAERTRSFREWRLLYQLRQWQLPVPAPVAASFERVGLFYRCDLITEFLPETESLSARLQRGPLPPSTWRAVGACVERFHARGVQHADLNAHNVLLDPNDQVWLLDFDRGRLRGPGAWTEHVWSRFHRSLAKVTRDLPDNRFGTDEWAELRRGANAAIQPVANDRANA